MLSESVDAILGQPTPDRVWLGAIVLQGPYYGVHTERAVREFLQRNPSTTLVILSTYLPPVEGAINSLSEFERQQLTNPRSRFYGRFICISCRVPSETEYPEFWKTNKTNQNLQRFSTCVGLNYAKKLGIVVSVKMRSDSFLALESCCLRLKTLVGMNPVISDASVTVKRRIVVSDLGVDIDRNPEFQHLGPYFIPDVWSFGFTEDLIKYFNIDDMDTAMPTEYCPETNLALRWKNSMGIRDDIKFAELMARYFIVIDRDDSLFFWPRWWNYQIADSTGDIKEFLRSQPRLHPERYTNSQWCHDAVEILSK